MNQNISTDIKNKISEDLSPTRKLTGLHLKIVAAIKLIKISMTEIFLDLEIGNIKNVKVKAKPK